ncbi:MAG TPA: NHLP leader peptide family RiPP precursor [Candidatus Polarisedimenticolaceae bacterium]|nr:NHLP leader peptide family RiPP precursor [Candidatus Polarisedimenticolaceae bacterium]
MSESMSRGKMQDLVGKFAVENPKYREALVSDPKKVLEQQFRITLPGHVKIKTLIETADTAYLVLPHVPGQGELSDSDLERVAGGLGDKEANCQRSPGSANTMTIINL